LTQKIENVKRPWVCQPSLQLGIPLIGALTEFVSTDLWNSELFKIIVEYSVFASIYFRKKT
jgi:hypothetical protein